MQIRSGIIITSAAVLIFLGCAAGRQSCSPSEFRFACFYPGVAGANCDAVNPAGDQAFKAAFVRLGYHDASIGAIELADPEYRAEMRGVRLHVVPSTECRGTTQRLLKKISEGGGVAVIRGRGRPSDTTLDFTVSCICEAQLVDPPIAVREALACYTCS